MHDIKITQYFKASLWPTPSLTFLHPLPLGPSRLHRVRICRPLILLKSWIFVYLGVLGQDWFCAVVDSSSGNCRASSGERIRGGEWKGEQPRLRAPTVTGGRPTRVRLRSSKYSDGQTRYQAADVTDLKRLVWLGTERGKKSVTLMSRI